MSIDVFFIGEDLSIFHDGSHSYIDDTGTGGLFIDASVLTLRDDNDEKLVKQIISAQMPRIKRLSRADIVLENSGTLEDLQNKTDNLHKKLTTLAKKKSQK